MKNFPFGKLIWAPVQYLSIQFPVHLVPHDVQLHATLPPTPWPHTGLCYHSEQFHIRILASSDILNDWLSCSLVPSLPLYLLFTLKVMLAPWHLTLNFLPVSQLFSEPLNYSITNTSTPWPETWINLIIHMYFNTQFVSADWKYCKSSTSDTSSVCSTILLLSFVSSLQLLISNVPTLFKSLCQSFLVSDLTS